MSMGGVVGVIIGTVKMAGAVVCCLQSLLYIKGYAPAIAGIWGREGGGVGGGLPKLKFSYYYLSI